MSATDRERIEGWLRRPDDDRAADAVRALLEYADGLRQQLSDLGIMYELTQDHAAGNEEALFAANEAVRIAHDDLGARVQARTKDLRERTAAMEAVKSDLAEFAEIATESLREPMAAWLRCLDQR